MWTPPSSLASSTRVARSPARSTASTSASPEAATRERRAPDPTRARRGTWRGGSARGSRTAGPAPVHNPRKMGYSAGGSASGSAAVVAAGEVPLSIGGDQGGSIRIPAAYCGIYGMKPTHGLVPYTGIMPIEITLDHTGPMSATVADNALLLEVLAGPDGLEPRPIGG